MSHKVQHKIVNKNKFSEIGNSSTYTHIAHARMHTQVNSVSKPTYEFPESIGKEIG